jgi:HSP20 family protein
MTEKTEMTKGSEKSSSQAQPSAAPALRPPVDIYEDAEGITIEADMPGVSKDRLNLQVDGNTLLIEGEAAINLPEGVEALYADVRVTHYSRSFTLSNELETEKIDASLKDGVLTLRIPKHPDQRPRKIEVRVA